MMVNDPLNRIRLGRTALEVTHLGLGTAPLGGLFSPISEEQFTATVERAWELGLRLFDTAPLYGKGVAEARLGAALAGRPRDEYVLSTKVGRLLRHNAPPDPETLRGLWKEAPALNPVFDFSSEGVLRSFSESLARLGLDRIDIALIHDPDDHDEEALAGAYPTLEQLQREGAIGAVGVGSNQVDVLCRFARETDVDCLLVAGRYTLLDHEGLAELLPLCVERGIAVIAGGVFNSGILADPQAGATFNYAPASRELIERAQRLRGVCEGHGVPLGAAAIQFPLAHPTVAAVVTGAGSVAELEENVEYARAPVPADLWAELKTEGLIPAAAPVAPPSPF
jgi:D-threo-aldose 1-dehydrogenase